jgi:hypothetical protein
MVLKDSKFKIPEVHVDTETLPCHDTSHYSFPDDPRYTLPATVILSDPEPDATVLSRIRGAD